MLAVVLDHLDQSFRCGLLNTLPFIFAITAFMSAHFFTSLQGLTENGGPEKGGPMKNNRCESNDRKLQEDENMKVGR